MDILKLLSAQGIEVPSDKAEGLKTAFNEQLSKVTSKIETERNSLRESLKTAQDTLKTFEGVDIKDLQGKVKTLTADLQTKEKEYQNKIADMEFTALLDNAVTSAGARNSKAAKALLDIETLKTSKNQSEDIKAALEKVKGENPFLFGSEEPINNPVAPSDTSPKGGISKEEFAKMGYLQRLEFKQKNPEKYNELKGE